jgi:hypothetical protein
MNYCDLTRKTAMRATKVTSPTWKNDLRDDSPEPPSPLREQTPAKSTPVDPRTAMSLLYTTGREGGSGVVSSTIGDLLRLKINNVIRKKQRL